jgi:hypothetical protein
LSPPKAASELASLDPKSITQVHYRDRLLVDEIERLNPFGIPFGASACDSKGMRNGISINVSRSDRRRLQALVADRNASQKHVWRAEIVLLTADGLGTNEIMRRKICVWRWQAAMMFMQFVRARDRWLVPSRSCN